MAYDALKEWCGASAAKTRAYLDPPHPSAYNNLGDRGGVAEWFKAVVLKTIGRKSQGFESSRLRQNLCDKKTH